MYQTPQVSPWSEASQKHLSALLCVKFASVLFLTRAARVSLTKKIRGAVDAAFGGQAG